jgi:predicted peptidase
MRFFTMLLAVLSLSTNIIKAQKKKIDNYSFKTWQSLGPSGISDNGKYLFYSYYSDAAGYDLEVCATDLSWKQKFTQAWKAKFTNDNKYLIVSTEQNLILLNLTSKKLEIIPEVNDFTTSSNGNWLAYKTNNDLNLTNLTSRISHKFTNVDNFWLTKQGNALVLSTDKKLTWVILPSFQEKKINVEAPSSGISFNDDGTAVAFIDVVKSDTSIYYYKPSFSKVKAIFSNNTPDFKNDYLIINSTPQFTSNGESLLFEIKQKAKSVVPDTNVITQDVDIWSYQDNYLQSQQILQKDLIREKNFKIALNIDKGNLVQLENRDTSLAFMLNQYAILKSTCYEDDDTYWNKDRYPSYILTSIKSGQQLNPIPDSQKVTLPFLSPQEKFMFWNDTLSRQLFCYDILSKKVVNITNKITYRLKSSCDKEDCTFTILGWMNNDGYVFISDSYDIWQVDPKGIKIPINITAGYGRKNKISFKLATINSPTESILLEDSLLLVGLDDYSKSNGFFKIKLFSETSPQKLSLDSCLYFFPGIFVNDHTIPPLKSKNANTYIVIKQNTDLAPNIFLTTDFKKFKQVSDIKPQEKYNWMTSELVHWESKDGENLSGILYKPQDFDPQKKYPIIFFYYELKSNEYHRFIDPDLSSGDLSIPWYVSNGYIVFLPDIHKKTGQLGMCALNSVESSADYLLKKYKWIDEKKMGLQGHSYGGYETFFIVTHSNKFCAAQPSAGITNLISLYGGLGFGEKSLAPMTKIGAVRMGAAPWDIPDIYIKNSPIFYANQVKTPLLIMHNKQDGVVPFEQSLEMFIALRSLHQKVWLVQYDGENHVLGIHSPASLDFTIRQEQFFDHFLKDAPIPIWMSEGIPTDLKGVKSGLSLKEQR